MRIKVDKKKNKEGWNCKAKSIFKNNFKQKNNTDQV
jgi:hypothetical protein